MDCAPDKRLKYRREVRDAILSRPLSLHQRPFDEQNPTVSSGSKSPIAIPFGIPRLPSLIPSNAPQGIDAQAPKRNSARTGA